jgi:hypothetical protein
MEIQQRGLSISGMQRTVNVVIASNVGLVAIVLFLVVCLVMQNRIVILQTPGMPPDSEIQKTSMDLGAQRAMLAAVTSNIAQVNPANKEYQKNFLQAYLSPAMYTKISAEIDTKVRLLLEQRELGSYYFVMTRQEYDPKQNKHFVLGDLHTVNAAKDTAEPYVFEYQLHVENYRPVIDDIVTYKGDKAHNSNWVETAKP